ncbi:hypothetical protein Dimus_002486 [Dionaea muscipula]
MADQDQALAAAEADQSRYKGVRKRRWGKWVSEIRLPNSRERIWLGSYDSAEKAARAFDAAQFCLRGRSARFNFPDNPPDIPGGTAMSPAEIQTAASRYANMEGSSRSMRQTEVDTSVSLLTTTAGEEEQPPLPSNSLSVSDMFDDGVYGSSSYPYMDGLTRFGSGNYASEFELVSGLGDGYPAPETPSHDYGVEDGNESSYHGSFLWNF